VLATIEARGEARMIVVDPSADRRRRVATSCAGPAAIPTVATPLGAIDLMERYAIHPRPAEHLTQTGTDEFCDFVAETNPNIKLALDRRGPRRRSPSISRRPATSACRSHRHRGAGRRGHHGVSLRGFAESVAAKPRR
jgi:hypothetical protein